MEAGKMNKPKEKYWTVTEMEIGRELGNPDYVQWADEQIAELKDLVEKQKKAIRLLTPEISAIIQKGTTK